MLQHIQSTDGGLHTVETSLLTGGWTLDAGCRDFSFSNALCDRQHVLALDPAQDVAAYTRYTFMQVALSHRAGYRYFYHDKAEPFSSQLVPIDTYGFAVENTYRVYCVTIELLLDLLRIEQFDCIKLDIEGEELNVLSELRAPVARQISVEFHNVIGSRYKRRDVYDVLSRWYRIAWDQETDTLFIAR